MHFSRTCNDIPAQKINKDRYLTRAHLMGLSEWILAPIRSATETRNRFAKTSSLALSRSIRGPKRSVHLQNRGHGRFRYRFVDEVGRKVGKE
jgi:hypothetical protein